MILITQEVAFYSYKVNVGCVEVVNHFGWQDWNQRVRPVQRKDKRYKRGYCLRKQTFVSGHEEQFSLETDLDKKFEHIIDCERFEQVFNAGLRGIRCVLIYWAEERKHNVADLVLNQNLTLIGQRNLVHKVDDKAFQRHRHLVRQVNSVQLREYGLEIFHEGLVGNNAKGFLSPGLFLAA